MDLATLISPMDKEAFLAGHFAQQPLLQRHGAAFAAGLPRIADVWALLEARQDVWRGERVLMARDGAYLPGEAFRRTDATGVERIDLARIRALVDAGSSLVARNAENDLPAISSLCRALESELGGYCFVNLYYSQPDRQALPVHYDWKEVMVIHLEGRKAWRLYERQAAAADEATTPTTARERCGRVIETPVLEPGDVLYLPRGRYHDALASEGPSLHATVSLEMPQRADLIRLLMVFAEQDPVLRSLFDPAADIAGGRIAPDGARRVLERLHRLAMANVEPMCAALEQRYAAARHTPPTDDPTAAQGGDAPRAAGGRQ